MAGKAMTSAKANRPVTLKHLAARLAADHEMSKRQGEAILGDLVTLITKHLKKGERIRIAGFGILQVRTRAARMGRKSHSTHNAFVRGLQCSTRTPARPRNREEIDSRAPESERAFAR